MKYLIILMIFVTAPAWSAELDWSGDWRGPGYVDSGTSNITESSFYLFLDERELELGMTMCLWQGTLPNETEQCLDLSFPHSEDGKIGDIGSLSAESIMVFESADEIAVQIVIRKLDANTLIYTYSHVGENGENQWIKAILTKDQPGVEKEIAPPAQTN